MAVSMDLTIRTFRMGTDKEAALKPLEEAAEVYNAWQILQDGIDGDEGDEFSREYIRGESERLADELSDVVQAACNLAERYGLDLCAAMLRCEERNRERGRYGD